MKYLFIVNPKSGKRKGDRIRLKIERFCAENQLQFDIWRWDRPEMMDEMMRKAIRSDFDMVVACGGDGTIHEVAVRLIHSDKILGVLPIGTGNAFANHFGIPLDTQKALEILKTGKVITIDAGKMNDRPFISFCGFGLDAKVACRYSTVKRRNFFTYAYFSLRYYWNYKPENIRIKIGNEMMEWNSHILSVANISQFGMKTVIAPGASAADGKLDLFAINIRSPFHFPMLFLRALRGSIGQSPNYQKVQVSEFQLVRPKSDIAQIDGEPSFTDETVTFGIIPQALKVMVPAEAENV